MVVIFHLFEAHSRGPLYQIINHGYLAVDFFFLLSGFVIGYAYDDRWKNMTVGNFFAPPDPPATNGYHGFDNRRHLFLFSGFGLWPAIHTVPIWKMLIIMLIGCTLIPVPLSMDIRGWNEMHPLNGPGWSLFFEYIANILYALFVRRFSKTLFMDSGYPFGYRNDPSRGCMGPSGDLIGGWSLEPVQLRIGFTRVMYPFFCRGSRFFRVGKLTQIKNAFFGAASYSGISLSILRLGGAEHLWERTLRLPLDHFYISFDIYIGASGEIVNARVARFCKSLGDISYPIYITHYLLIYLYTAWVYDHKLD